MYNIMGDVIVNVIRNVISKAIDKAFKRKYVLSAAVLCVSFGVFAGCAESDRNDNVTVGMTMIEQMDYQSALEAFDAADMAEENERLIYRGRGIAYMGLTDYGQAIDNFIMCLNLSDGMIQDIDFDVNYYLATAYFKNGNYREAADTYTAIIDLRPDEENAHYLRGIALLALDDYIEAQKDFDKVLTVTEGDCDKLIEIYQSLDNYGYREIGQEYLNRILSEKNDKLDDYDKGRIYYYLREYPQACNYLEKSKDTGTAEAYLYLGRAYEATGDYNYASSVYTSYVAKDTSNAEVYNQLGLCRLEQGEYQLALEAFQAAMGIENNGMLQVLQFNEIVAYEYLGEYKKAAVLMDNYVKMYPDDELAKREYEFLKTR